MDFISIIEDCLGKSAEKIFMPMQDGDVVSTYADVKALMNDFDYKPMYTPLKNRCNRRLLIGIPGVL